MSSPPPPKEAVQAWGPYVSVVIIIAANIICYCCNDNSMVGRRLWKRYGGSLLLVTGEVGRKRPSPQEFWAFDVLDPSCMVTSHFVPDGALVAVHLLTLLWLMISLVVEQTKDDPLRSSWMTFFTHWSLVLLSLSGGLGLLTQARYLWRCSKAGVRGATAVVPAPEPCSTAADTGLSIAGTSNPKRTRSGEDKEAGLIQWDWLTITYLLTMETAVTAAFFLDVYYWAVLVGVQGYTVSGPATFLKHAGNLGVAFLEVFLTRMPVVSFHLQVVIAYATGYAVMVWIYGGVADVWRYSLNWHKVSSVITFGAIPIALCLFLLIWLAITLLREAAGTRFRTWRERRDAAYSQAGEPTTPDEPVLPLQA